MQLNGFTFSEAIEGRYLRFLKPEMILSTTITPETLLIRLLTGTVQLTNNLSTDSFDQFSNYSILGAPTNTIISTKHLKECVEPESNLTNLVKHLLRTRGNAKFFENILEEYSSYFYKSAKNSFTTGFLHLYRCLEYISYSFPLLYASIDTDYYGSFTKLKNYFDSSKSELVFFEVFVEKLMDDSQLDSHLIFNFNTFDINVNKNHYQIIKRLLPEDKIIGDTTNVSLTTTYRQLIDLSIKLRNRYFHFSSGDKRNIKGTEIIENDIFFANINDELANWMALIYFEILKHMCER